MKKKKIDVNKVVLSGEIFDSQWSSSQKNKTNGFYITIIRKRNLKSRVHTDFFQLFANQPLAQELERYVKEGNEEIAIEGVLKTYKSKYKGWQTVIEVTKILDSFDDC